MKKIARFGLAGFLGLALSNTCGAYTIGSGADTIEVGDPDIFLRAEQLANAGDKIESAWVNGLLGTDYLWDIREEELTATVANEDANVLVVALPDANMDLYFVIKNDVYTALFENVNSLDWAVLNTSQEITVTDKTGIEQTGLFGDFFNLSSEQLLISHVTMVPEPSTVALMGLGFFALGFAVRRSNNSSVNA